MNDRKSLAWIAGIIAGALISIGIVTTFPNPIGLGVAILGATVITMGVKAGVMSLFSTHDRNVEIENKKLAEERQNDFSKENLVTGISVLDFRKVIREARAKLVRISDMSNGLYEVDLQRKLANIVVVGNRIIDEVLNDPKDFATARSWFNTHLDQVETIVRGYLEVQSVVLPPVRENFVNTLDDLNINFNNLLEHLKENDMTSLKVDLAVLNDQLKVENR